MKHLLRNKNFWVILVTDTGLVCLSCLLAYLIRFEGGIPPEQLDLLMQTLPWIVPLKIAIFAWVGLYRGMWRYTSIGDLINIIKGTVIAAGAVALVLVLVRRFDGFSRSVLILDALITMVLVGGIRLLIRVYIQRTIPASFFNPAFFPFFNADREKRTRLLIVGAGDAAEKMLREILDNPRIHYRPVGFLDDNPRKRGQTIHGVPVLGAIEEIETLPIQFDEILIAIPSAPGDVMRRVVELCDRTGKRFRTIPKINELIEGRITVNAIREVRLEDLVNRQEVRLDPERISRFLCGKRILVTGAGGSIGSELVRQISRFQPQVVGLLDFSELNLFLIEQEFQRRLCSLPTVSFLTDIRDREALKAVMERFRPHILFHAAAYKHVPMQERHPREAVLNNVLGTRNLVDLAVESEVERFVLVSTDKAVRPTNVMGATKRVAELFVENMNGKQVTRFVAVRFGNVFSSSGSAIPIFQEQIASGGPVTVTHPDVRRYFMSIPEAAQLILQAGAMGEGGEIFILDMGEPIRIVDMARDLIRLHGLEPDRDIAIEFTGLRPGEKLHEELITYGEGIVPTTHEKIMVLRGKTLDGATLLAKIEALLTIAKQGDGDAIRKKLRDIVPEYAPPS
ncbi:MAG: UDP-N-acetyl-alpha-D-glucosamine C6 dehydratase [Syntrophaceae bacterium PtaU1.Bin231]|nr:MAG: UDP-N-acetyl-alpha-D-glucosamine C6 dehydratase [Syntrophaceae bacterium PtaU1.Bin231]